MPYCNKCSYWMPGRENRLNKTACPNCGQGPFARFRSKDAEPGHKLDVAVWGESLAEYLLPWEKLSVSQQAAWQRKLPTLLGITLGTIGFASLMFATS